MAHLTTSSVIIARPIEDVFAALTNVENTERWFPAKVREWWTSAAPHGVGSTRHAEIATRWFRSQNDAVVTHYEAPRRAVMQGTSRSAPFRTTLNFDRVDGGTRVEATTELFLRGPAGRLGPMLIRWLASSWKRGLVTLKALMESGEL